MSTESNNKRSLDTEEPDPKRSKSDPTTNDLETLRLSIEKEISSGYNAKISDLNKEIAALKEKNAQLEAKLAAKPPLPPRDTSSNPASSQVLSSSSGENSATLVSRHPTLQRQSEKSDSDKPKHTFGGTSFNFKPTVATPTNSHTEPKQIDFTTPKDSATNSSPNTIASGTVSSTSTPQPQPRPVFGATTSFGSSLDASKRKNVFADLPSQPIASPLIDGTSTSTEAPTKAAAASSFGANTKFSGAFKSSIAKKSFLDTDTPSPSDTETKEPEPKSQQQFKQVDLNPVKNTTGEENEESHFNSTCKLFELEFDNIKDGWKERGLGNLHLNQSIHNQDQVRLVMRSNGLLRVILNSKITKKTEMIKGLEASLAPGKYLRFNSVNEHGRPVQYLLKFSNQGLRDDLVEKVETLKQEMDS